MPLGLRNSAQTFQRFMDTLLRRLPFVRAYLDDLLVLSRSPEEHLEHLRLLFETLRDARLAINWEKSRFAKSQVDHLGYTISRDGYSPPAQKVDAIREFPKPESARQLRRFLGMLSYYRRCIPRAADIQAPLHALLQGLPKNAKAPLAWTPEANQAFDDAKGSIASAITPAFLAHAAPLSLATDASSTAVGAALEQLEGGTWKPIGFFSRKLSDTERRYSAYDRELLAVFAAIKFFRSILEGRSFVVRTDHKPLIYAAQQRSDKASPRVQRQLDFILQFNVRFEAVKGEDNVVADALSRTCSITMPTLLDAATIRQSQLADDELPHLRDAAAVQLRALDIEGNTVFCDISTGTVRPYIPSSLRRSAFNVVHALSHPSGRSTARLLAQKFFWPGLKKDAARWSRECEPCQRAKVHRHNRSTLNTFAEPDNRFDHVHVDLIKLPLVNGFQYCLTVIDRFSRWPLAVPLRDMQASTVAGAFMSQWVCQYGTPLTITSDQGTQFESALFTALAKLIGASRIRTTPYHPQSNGLVERLHRTLKAALMCSSQTPWPELLPTVLLGLRTTFKEDLQASPAEMLYGTALRVPGEFFVKESIPANPSSFVDRLRAMFHAVKPVQASRHARQHPFFFKDLRTCSHVFKQVQSVRRPLEPPYTGPHEIVRRIDDKRYVIRVNGVEKTVSTDSLKPAYLDAQDSTPPPVTPPSDQQAPLAANSPAILDPSSSTPAVILKRVSFSSPPDEVTGGGVPVAPCLDPRPATRTDGRRRKQALIARPLF